MLCGIEPINNNLRAGVATPPSTPAVLLPSPYGGSCSSDQPNSSLNQRMTQGTCFRCHQPGHWRENCPLKWEAAEKPPPPSPNLLIVRCHCGLICFKNVIAGKEVYRCSNPKVKCSVRIPAEEVKVIMCPCGVGAAALNVTITVKFGHIKFYACRIKKGLGACGFVELEHPRHWENKEIMEFVLKRVRGQLSPEDYKELGNSCPAKLQEVESSSRDLVLLEAETFNPIMEQEATHISGSEIHCRQMEFDNQISAAAMESSTIGGSTSNDVQHVPTGMEIDSSAGIASAIVVVSSSSIPQRAFSAVEEDQSTRSEVNILGENVQTELAMILQSLEQLQLHPSKNALQVLIQQMNSYGHILQARASSLMTADTESFHSSKAELRSAISRLEVQTQVEKSDNFLHESDNFLHESYNADGSLLDGVCSAYTHTMAALAASDEQLKVVSQHAFAIRDTLLKISSQVQSCQTEILKLDTFAMETYSKMVKARTTIMAASENLLRITKSCQQRNGQYHSSVLPSKRVELSSNKFDMVRERKRQKLETSSTKLLFPMKL